MEIGEEFVEPKPVDVTTIRTTPQRTRTAIPSSTVILLDGGVLRIVLCGILMTPRNLE
jgi:hypothetical protein